MNTSTIYLIELTFEEVREPTEIGRQENPFGRTTRVGTKRRKKYPQKEVDPVNQEANSFQKKGAGFPDRRIASIGSWRRLSVGFLG